MNYSGNTEKDYLVRSTKLFSVVVNNRLSNVFDSTLRKEHALYVLSRNRRQFTGVTKWVMKKNIVTRNVIQWNFVIDRLDEFDFADDIYWMAHILSRCKIKTPSDRKISYMSV